MTRLTFPASRRLTHDLQYQAVYGARMKKVRGPLIVFALRNELPHHRLGLAVGKRVGNAPARNRVKRLLRESFRQLQHNLPRAAEGAYDLVVSARAHQPLPQSEYQRLLAELVQALHTEWGRRDRRRVGQSDPSDQER